MVKILRSYTGNASLGSLWSVDARQHYNEHVYSPTRQKDRQRDRYILQATINHKRMARNSV